MSQTHERIIDRFHLAAKQAGLEYFIIGGFAASYWGTARFTADIDYVIEQSAFENAKRVLAALNYTLLFIHPRGSFAHFASSTEEAFRIDLMLVDTTTWHKLVQGGERGDFGGPEAYPVVALMHLIAMKLHASVQPDRTEFRKDLTDIVEVMQVQNISLEQLEQAGILERYGNELRITELKQLLDEKRPKLK